MRRIAIADLRQVAEPGELEPREQRLEEAPPRTRTHASTNGPASHGQVGPLW